MLTVFQAAYIFINLLTEIFLKQKNDINKITDCRGRIVCVPYNLREKMSYTKNYFIHYFSTDIKRNLRVTSLMKFFEDIAVLQSESLNVGLDYYEKEKCAWVMYKWDVKFINIQSLWMK